MSDLVSELHGRVRTAALRAGYDVDGPDDITEPNSYDKALAALEYVDLTLTLLWQLKNVLGQSAIDTIVGAAVSDKLAA